jgi:hypothetical protein
MKYACALLILLAASLAQAQERPTTQPSRINPDETLKQLLSPSRPQIIPLNPEPDQASPNDATNPNKVVLKGGQQLNLIREGTRLPERVARLTRTADGQAELTFESDGQSLVDPPMLILPNLWLATMEKAITNTSRDLKFRISGTVTEYGNRNYILLEKVVVVPDETIPPPGRVQRRDNKDPLQ